MSKKYPQGKHPNSLANLSPGKGGRPKGYAGVEKKRRSLTVSDDGWVGLQPVIKELGCTSVSDFLEKLGRGQVEIKISA